MTAGSASTPPLPSGPRLRPRVAPRACRRGGAAAQWVARFRSRSGPVAQRSGLRRARETLARRVTQPHRTLGRDRRGLGVRACLGPPALAARPASEVPMAITSRASAATPAAVRGRMTLLQFPRLPLYERLCARSRAANRSRRPKGLRAPSLAPERSGVGRAGRRPIPPGAHCCDWRAACEPVSLDTCATIFAMITQREAAFAMAMRRLPWRGRSRGSAPAMAGCAG
jgi:hypothetical protein